jgi:protein transport protein HofQ
MQVSSGKRNREKGKQRKGEEEMKTKQQQKTTTTLFAILMFALVTVLPYASAQNPPATPAPSTAEATNEEPEQQMNNKVSISVTEARIQDVLRSLAAMRPGTTMMIDPAVSGTVSFELQDVPWEIALQLVAEQNGLMITQRAENIFLVEQATGMAQEKAQEDILVELYTVEEIKVMEDYELIALLSQTQAMPEGATVEEVRAELMRTPGFLIKHLAVTNKPAVEVIEALARKSSIDFVFSTHFKSKTAAPAPAAEGGAPAQPSVTSNLPPISLNITNKALPTALKLIADQGGLSVTEQDGVWVVKPLRAEEIEMEPLVTQTFRVRYIPVDEKLQSDVKSMLSERGTMVSRGKIITVFDTAERIDKISRIIEDQDIPTPQVLIEARFFVLNNTDSDELGIDWTTLTTSAADGGGMNFNIQPDANMTWQYMEGNLVSDPDIHTATLTLPQLNAVLRALKNDDNAKQLSNPKIIVSSDEQATIHIGRQEPIIKSSIDNSGDTAIITYELDEDFGGETVQVTDLLADQGDSTATETSYTGYKGYLDLGTKLTVAPSVKTEDEVYIKVIPELINRPGEVVLDIQTFPILFRVRVQTEFTVRSGQTIAIGGLVSEDITETSKHVPGLSAIPLIGEAFKYDSKESIRSETIIFLTVKVLSPQEIETTTGIPVRAREVQDVVNDIRREDADGAVYNEERVKTERAERARLKEERKLSRRVERFFNPEQEQAVEAEAQEAVEAEEAMIPEEPEMDPETGILPAEKVSEEDIETGIIGAEESDGVVDVEQEAAIEKGIEVPAE